MQCGQCRLRRFDTRRPNLPLSCTFNAPPPLVLHWTIKATRHSVAPCPLPLTSPRHGFPPPRPDSLRPACQGSHQYCARSSVAPCSACRKHNVRARVPGRASRPASPAPPASPNVAGSCGAALVLYWQHGLGRLHHARRRAPGPWRRRCVGTRDAAQPCYPMAYLRSGSQRWASTAREVMQSARLLSRAPRGLLLHASRQHTSARAGTAALRGRSWAVPYAVAS